MPLDFVLASHGLGCPITVSLSWTYNAAVLHFFNETLSDVVWQEQQVGFRVILTKGK